MKDQQVVVSGKTNDQGVPLIFDKHQMDKLFKQWPNTGFTMEINIKAKGSSGSQIGYYKKVVLPGLQKGWQDIGEQYTIDETDLEIRKLSPFCHKQDPEEGGIIVSATSLSMNEMREHIEFCIRIAAQMMGVSISPPKL